MNFDAIASAAVTIEWLFFENNYYITESIIKYQMCFMWMKNVPPELLSVLLLDIVDLH